MPRRKRREKGTGSLHKLKSRGWTAQRELAPVEGKRRYERISFGADRAAAVGQLAAWEKEQAAVARHPRATDSCQSWLEHVLVIKKDAVEASSLKFYHRHFNYAIPRLGPLALVDVDASVIRETLAALTALSTQSRKHVYTVLKMAFQIAVDDGIILRNPCDTVEPPKVTKFDAYAMNQAELAAFFAVIEGHRLEALLRLMADLGMRFEEALALRWGDYDRERRTLRIHDTKNNKYRHLSLSEDQVGHVDHHWDRLQVERTDNPKWKERGYLFPSEVGTKLLQDNVRRTFKNFLEKADLPDHIRVHDLRHTAATNLIAAGNDIPTVQYITGHKDSSVLLEIYSHHQDERNREAVEKVEARRKKRG